MTSDRSVWFEIIRKLKASFYNGATREPILSIYDRSCETESKVPEN